MFQCQCDYEANEASCKQKQLCFINCSNFEKTLNENSDSEILIFIKGVTYVVPENHFNDFPGPFDNFQAVKIINW